MSGQLVEISQNNSGHNPVNPQIDIVIVTFNNSEHIADLVTSIMMQEDIVPHIFFVDNSPNSQTFTAIKTHAPQSWVVHSDCNLGFGAAVNYGVRHGNSPWVLVLNPDARFRYPYDLRKLINQHMQLVSQELSGIILGPKIIYPDGTQYPSGRSFPSPITGSVHAIKTLFSSRGASRYLYPENIQLGDNLVASDWISGAAFIIPRSTFNDLGGFDKRYFMYAEDMDLCWRLRCRGGLVVRWDGVSVEHIGGASTLRSSRSISWHHISLLKFIIRSFRGVQRLSLPIVIPGLILRWVLALFQAAYLRWRTKMYGSSR